MIEQLRSQYRNILSQLQPSDKEEWGEIVLRFQELDTPPTPQEWVNQLQKYHDECLYENSLRAWERYRDIEEAGWGLADVKEIKGWSDNLPPATKSLLIRQQMNYELSVQFAYEDYMADR
jgi:hypothetical protein